MHLRTLGLTTAALLLSTATFAQEVGTGPNGETLAEEQTFSYRLLDQFPTLDPQLNEETAGFHVIRQLFEGLLAQDENGDLIPGVAESWEASEENTVWTFTLREDAQWSNGDPVTAQDFVYAWQRAADPETASPYGWYVELTNIVGAAEVLAGEAEPSTMGVEAVDDRTLRVTLTQPTPYFPAMTTYATLFPAHQPTIEEHGADWTSPENMVGNGAYMLDEIVLNEFFRYVKSPTYWDAENVTIEEVTGYVINDANQALTRWRAGEFDMMDDLPTGQFPALQAELPDEAFSVPRLCSYYYAYNFTESGDPALQDQRVRKALSLAIDRDVIVDQVLKGGQSAAYNFAHAATAGFEMPDIPEASMTQAERDDMAVQLMEEARADGVELDGPLQLIYNTSEAHQQIATVVSQMWRQKLGVETELANYEWQTYLDIRGNQNFDVARSAWCGDYNEASTFLDLLTTPHGANDGKFSNAELDELMAASKTSDDPNAEYTQVEQIIADEAAIAPIYHYANTFVLDSAVKGFPLNNVENNWYVKDFYRIAEE